MEFKNYIDLYNHCLFHFLLPPPPFFPESNLRLSRLRADVNLKPQLVPKNTPSPSKALTENTTAESVREHSEASPYSDANLYNADVRTPEKNQDNLSKMVDENSAQRINDSPPFKQLSIQQYQRKYAQSTR